MKLPKGGLYIHSGLFLFGWYSRHLAAKFKSMTKTAEIEKWARERGLLKFNETLFRAASEAAAKRENDACEHEG